MSAAASYNSRPSRSGVSGQASTTHWETENRMVWNQQQHTSEEHEFVYEISWITELGVWRRFLRSQRLVKN